MDLINLYKQHKQTLAGLFLIAWGTGVFLLKRFNIQTTSFFVTGWFSQLIGLIVIAIGIYILKMK